MNEIQARRPRLNAFGRAAQTRRIFARLREGWAYEEIGQEEGVTAERIRQIVSVALEKRIINHGPDYARLQLERLAPALKLAGESVARGELKAIGPLLKVIDRIDRHQTTVIAKHDYDPDARRKLLDKLNQMARNVGHEGDIIPILPEDYEDPSKTDDGDANLA